MPRQLTSVLLVAFSTLLPLGCGSAEPTVTKPENPAPFAGGGEGSPEAADTPEPPPPLPPVD